MLVQRPALLDWPRQTLNCANVDIWKATGSLPVIQGHSDDGPGSQAEGHAPVGVCKITGSSLVIKVTLAANAFASAGSAASEVVRQGQTAVGPSGQSHIYLPQLLP